MRSMRRSEPGDKASRSCDPTLTGVCLVGFCQPCDGQVNALGQHGQAHHDHLGWSKRAVRPWAGKCSDREGGPAPALQRGSGTGREVEVPVRSSPVLLPPGPPMPLVNRVVAAVLRSPAAGLLKGVCLLTYVGPRTGRFVRLPVQFARDDDCLVVLPARSTQKTWWRSFGEPRPVDVLLGGVLRAGVARTVLHTDPGRSEAEGRYRTGHPKADLSHDPLVVIRLEPLGPASPTCCPGCAGCPCWRTGRTG